MASPMRDAAPHTQDASAAAPTAAGHQNSLRTQQQTRLATDIPQTAQTRQPAIAGSNSGNASALHHHHHQQQQVASGGAAVNQLIGTTASAAAAATATSSAKPQDSNTNFEYDDNEWDIGIGDLIIDLDADIEKTAEGALNQQQMSSGGSAAAAGGTTAVSATGGPGSGVGQIASGAQQSAQGGKPKMAVEHSATVDKGLKMKIKRTKPGTKTSEAKHEIVKSNEQNGSVDSANLNSTGATTAQGANDKQVQTGKHNQNQQQSGAGNQLQTQHNQNSAKRGSSGHRRDKTKEKPTSGNSNSKPSAPSGTQINSSDTSVNGVVTNRGVTHNSSSSSVSSNSSNQRPTTPQRNAQNSSAQSNLNTCAQSANAPGPPVQVNLVTPAQNSAQVQTKGQTDTSSKVAAVVIMPSPAVAQAQAAQTAQTQNAQQNLQDDRSSSPPPTKKLKTSTSEPKGMSVDVCVGTSVGTITEPDCLGPCEPGTSVTLEGIVWHETEGGVLVVNVTWRGKTYVGTLLDCTRHDWAPPRFCDSPTSDLDARTPKGRAKRGRAAANTTPGNDLSNFTETRSSLHSKLRNGGGKGRGGRGAPSTPTPSNNSSNTGTSSPTPFLPPRNAEPASNKRKSRTGEEEPSAPTTGKKTRVTPVPTPPAASGSPPASPVLLECPEPNCSKKYKHINGLKYHQSHAHGSADDDDTKDVTSMSENDESNIEAPSPITPVKSPEKIPEAPATPVKKEENNSTNSVAPISVPELINTTSSQPETPRSTPPSPQTNPQTNQVNQQNSVTNTPVEQTVTNSTPNTQNVDNKTAVVKPGVLRFGPQEDYPMGNFTAAKPPTSNVSSMPNSVANLTTVRAVSVNLAPSQPNPQPNNVDANLQAPSFPIQISPQVSQNVPIQTQMSQNPQIPSQNPPILNQNQQIPHQIVPQVIPQSPIMNHLPLPGQNIPQSPQNNPNKVPQFKVKPTAALMPNDDKNILTDKNKPNPNQSYKKSKNRKSPAGSPHPPESSRVFGNMEMSGRDEVQSPAYSDISDDGAPVETIEDKNKMAPVDKKVEPGQPIQHSMPQYGMYPFYGQPPYMVPSVQQQVQQEKPKDAEKAPEKPGDKDPKKDGPEFQQKILPQHPYYPYGYVPGYPYNIEPSYGAVSMVPEDKIKEERIKESPSPAEHNNKPVAPIPNPIQVPTPGKVKTEPKEKHPNENHQILKESIEMKNQMSSYMYARQPQSQQAHVNHHHHSQSHNQQREEEMRRYYLYPDQQRRKDGPQNPEPPQSQKNPTPNKPPPQSPSIKHKEKAPEEKKKEDITKQEGVKPTMETQGPPPPPTSQYAYIHPSYMQSPHYGTLPFDPNHPMYRSMLVTGPYSGNPYLNPHIPRYHAPEDLSRPPQGPTKALDLLQHHANQYYTSHKIHELQERAIKSPTPKTSVASSSPSSNAPPPTSGAPSGPPQGPPTSQAQSGGPQQSGKQTPSDKDSRSPPPQRHVHTHHHTHVGLGYPLYPAPYGAAVLASQQAAAVTVINPYPPK